MSLVTCVHGFAGNSCSHCFRFDAYENEVLNERQKSYGNYQTNAQISQQLKYIMRETPKWRELSSDKQESLEMIALKISRILNGDDNYKDSWDDIAGYANLIGEKL